MSTDAITRLTAALVDRYRIERELGAGGMATVYLAEDLKHQRKVAIKVLRPELAAAIGAERFLAEIKTTANLQHPHILPLFDSGVAFVPSIIDDRSSMIDPHSASLLYYVMPFIDGESLRDKLNREHQLDLAESLEITHQVASALAYAHERGIIHRDIKPENILLSSGQAIVADFGIARAVGAAGGAQLTAIGTAIGTPTYMSPEQSAGMSDVDGRADTYALASVLFEMLTGEPPHTGATAAAIISKRLGTPAPSARVLRDSIPKSVDGALQRALQRAPADRFATATEFAAALRTGTREFSIPFSRRIGIGIVAFAAVVAMSWFVLKANRAETGLDADVIAVLPFRVGGDPAINYLRESMLDLLQARLNTGSGPRTVEPRTLLAAWRQEVANDDEDLSEAASRALARQLGAGRVLLGSAVITPSELTLSGTLIRVADGTVLARESATGAPDSVAVLVNRLTAALLIRGAGEARERQAGLAAAPLDALQDYLAARKANRRGDYFGAMELYGKALGRDSTFVEAAFGMVATNAWIGTVFETRGYGMVPRVWQLRDRLSPRDLALFLAMPIVGPNYPRPSSYREIITQAERAANLAPDSPEPLLLLGQLLSSAGGVAGEVDWVARSAAALDRAIALDSSFTKAVEQRLYPAIQARDTQATRRYATLLEQRVAAGFNDNFMLWVAARSLGDSGAAMKWRNQMVGLQRTDYMQAVTRIALHSAQYALPLTDARWAVSTLWRDAGTDTERLAALLADLALRFASGRSDPGAAPKPPLSGPGWGAALMQQALIEPAYRSMAAKAIADDSANGNRPRTPADAAHWDRLRDCYTTLYRVTVGDTNGTGDAVRRMEASALAEGRQSAPEAAQQVDPRVCTLTLQVLVEEIAASGTARPQLERLDSLLQGGPQWFSGNAVIAPTAFANFTVARLRAAQGDYPAALAAIRRREMNLFPPYLWSLPAFLRQEGRLAAIAGDTAGALRAYDQYLTLRTDPDPPFRAQRDSVVAERAALQPH